jgi:hypothetical protein
MENLAVKNKVFTIHKKTIRTMVGVKRRLSHRKLRQKFNNFHLKVNTYFFVELEVLTVL